MLESIHQRALFIQGRKEKIKDDLFSRKQNIFNFLLNELVLTQVTEDYFTTVLLPKKIIKWDVSPLMHSAEVQYRSKHVLVYDPISIAAEAKLLRAWINTSVYANNPQTWLYFMDGIGKTKWGAGCPPFSQVIRDRTRGKDSSCTRGGLEKIRKSFLGLTRQLYGAPISQNGQKSVAGEAMVWWWTSGGAGSQLDSTVLWFCDFIMIIYCLHTF